MSPVKSRSLLHPISRHRYGSVAGPLRAKSGHAPQKRLFHLIYTGPIKQVVPRLRHPLPSIGARRCPDLFLEYGREVLRR
jgi:hypothetical protein